jgi:hypothetical protein
VAASQLRSAAQFSQQRNATQQVGVAPRSNAERPTNARAMCAAAHTATRRHSCVGLQGVCGLLLHPELHQRCLLNMRRMNSTCTKCGNDSSSSSSRHVTLLRTARECVIITFMRVGHMYMCRSVCVCVLACMHACMHADGCMCVHRGVCIGVCVCLHA